MYVVSTRVNDQELDPSLLLAALQKAEDKAIKEEKAEEKQRAPKKLSKLGEFMHSPELQTKMLRLLICHLFISFVELPISKPQILHSI